MIVRLYNMLVYLIFYNPDIGSIMVTPVNSFIVLENNIISIFLNDYNVKSVNENLGQNKQADKSLLNN